MSQLESGYPRLERLQIATVHGKEVIPIHDTSFTIGRNVTATFPIMSISISRKHCVIKKVDNGWTVTDYSSFGTKLNGKIIGKENETALLHGDVLQLDMNSPAEFTYKFLSAPSCPSAETTPVAKRRRLDDPTSEDRLQFEKSCDKRQNEMQRRFQAAQIEQSQIQEQEELLHNSYQRKIQELENKFITERQQMEQKAIDGEAHQKSMEKDCQDMEERLQVEKEELKIYFDKEKELLQRKVEEQRKIEDKLKEDNEKLQAQMESERREFEERLAAERRQLEESSEKARLKAEEEKAELESRLLGRLEQLKEEQEAEKCNFNQQLEKGTLDKQKLEEQHQLITQQLEEQKVSAAQQLNEKQALEEKLQAMEKALKEKEQQQQALSEELIKKEAEKALELELLRAQQEAENHRIKQEMLSREQTLRSSLDSKIETLKNDKLKLEADIRVEMNVESLENKNRYEIELDKVKKQLGLMESKKQVLEQELANNTQEKEKVNESCLKAKQKVLEDVSEMMQSELQCQICSELFVVATTLNCTHTFCKLCITDWKRKQTKAVADCPVCRAPIVSENRSIVLDNFIDKMVESLSDELKEQRKQLLLERGGRQVAQAGPSTASTSNALPQHQHRQRFFVDQLNRFIIAGAPNNVRLVQQVPSTSRGPAPPAVPPPAVPPPTGARQRGNRANRGGNRRQTQAQRHVPVAPQAAVRLVTAPQAPPPRHVVPAPQAPPRHVVPVAQAPAAHAQAARAVQRPVAQIPPPAHVQPTSQRVAPRAQPQPNIPVPPVAAEIEITEERRQGPPAAETALYVSSDSDSSEDEHHYRDRRHRYDSDEPESDSDELMVPGLPNSVYKGYGKCYSCGMKGHWAPGCPFK